MSYINNTSDTTLQDCLYHVKSRFKLCLIATYRARQLSQGHASKVHAKFTEKKRKNTSIALIEIAHGAVGLELLKKVPDINK